MHLLAIFGVLILGFGTVLPTEPNPNGPPRPPIYSYDDYERCITDYRKAVYCIATVGIRAEEQMLPMEEEFMEPESEISQHPNILSWGVCIQDCQSELPMQETLRIEHETAHASNKSEETAIACIHNRLRKQYNSTGYVQMEYCESEKDRASNPIIDLIGLAFMCICFVLFGITLFATAEDNLNQPVVPNAPNILQAFSMHRNWAGLSHVPESMAHQNFRYIAGIRVLACVAVIFVHAVCEPFVLPTSTPEVLQRTANGPWGLTANVLMPIPMQIFFTISGLLLTIHFLEQRNQLPHFEDLWRYKILMRLFRLIPTYALWVMFTMSWFETVSNGPMAYHTLKAPSVQCQRAWFNNFQFINNIPMTNDLCMEHTWYLAADFQFYVLALGLLTIVWRNPQAAWGYFFKTTIGIVLLQYALAYYYHLDPMFLSRISEMLYGALHYRWLTLMFLNSHTAASYLAGIIAGHTYVTIRNGGYDFRGTTIYKVVREFSIFLLASMLLASSFLFRRGYDSTSIWSALFVTTQKFYLPLVVSICFIDTIGQPPGWGRSFLGRPIFVILGKLCYIVYIVHYSVIKLLYSRDNPNSEVDVIKIMSRFVLATTVSFGLALMIYLCMEQPLKVYLKAIMQFVLPGLRGREARGQEIREARGQERGEARAQERREARGRMEARGG